MAVKVSPLQQMQELAAKPIVPYRNSPLAPCTGANVREVLQDNADYLVDNDRDNRHLLCPASMKMETPITLAL